MKCFCQGHDGCHAPDILFGYAMGWRISNGLIKS
jgi:hypothetical protein